MTTKQVKESREHTFIEGTCWCRPIFRKIRGQGFWFHRDENNETALKLLKTN